MNLHHPTRASRAAAVATLLVGLMLVPLMVSGPLTPILLLEGGGVLIGGAAAVSLWLSNSFESRLFASMLCTVVALITVLGLLVGLPGSNGAEELTASRVLILAACAVTWALIAVDARARARERESNRRPYAV